MWRITADVTIDGITMRGFTFGNKEFDSYRAARDAICALGLEPFEYARIDNGMDDVLFLRLDIWRSRK